MPSDTQTANRATFYDLRQRYREDPVFNTIVRQMEALMVEHKISPYEIRDAAAMASLIFADKHIEPIFIADRFPEADELLRRYKP